MPAVLHDRAEYRGAAGKVQRPARVDALSSAAPGSRLSRRPVRRLRALGGPDRIGEARRPARARHGPGRPATPPGRRRRRHAARERRARRRKPPASPIASRSSARSATTSCIDLYAGALAVAYPPYDEDFGYVTLEAFLARKPVVTCVDSGGPNEFVVDGDERLHAARRSPRRSRRRSTARRRSAPGGDAGRARATRSPRSITWDGVIERLVE